MSRIFHFVSAFLLLVIAMTPIPAARAEPPAPSAPAAASSSQSTGQATAAGEGVGLYVQFDDDLYGITQAAGYPVAGGHQRYQWKAVNPDDGVYNFATIGRWISEMAAQGKMVGIEWTIYNGRGTTTTSGIQIPDWVLTKYPAIKVRNTCYPTPPWYVIDYRVSGLLTEYSKMIDAFANYLSTTNSAHDPSVKLAANVAWVGIGIGAYGETQPVPDSGGNSSIGYNTWDDSFYRGASPCTTARMPDRPGAGESGLATTDWLDMWVKPVTDAYHEAFYNLARPNLSHIRLYQASIAPTYRWAWERQVVAQYSALKEPPVGLKHAGLLVDHGFAVRYSTAEGTGDYSYDPMIKYAETPNMPLGWESYAIWLRNDAELYWGTLATLDKHAHLLLYDRHMMDSASERAILQWAVPYLGVSKSTTPSVWVALRETGLCSTPGCAPDRFPELGNHSFWLYQDDSVAGGRTRAVSYRTRDELNTWPNGAPNPDVETQYGGLTVHKEKEGWIARRTDLATSNPSMFFKIDDGYIAPGAVTPVTITVTYFDGGTDRWHLRYDDVNNTSGGKVARALGSSDDYVQKTNSNHWRTARFVITDGRWAGSLPGASDFLIDSVDDGDEIVHMVDVAKDSSTPPSLPCDGDVDASGLVDVTDIQLLVNAFRQPTYDLTGDGIVTLADVMLAASQYGKSLCP